MNDVFTRNSTGLTLGLSQEQLARLAFCTPRPIATPIPPVSPDHYTAQTPAPAELSLSVADSYNRGIHRKIPQNDILHAARLRTWWATLRSDYKTLREKAFAGDREALAELMNGAESSDDNAAVRELSQLIKEKPDLFTKNIWPTVERQWEPNHVVRLYEHLRISGYFDTRGDTQFIEYFMKNMGQCVTHEGARRLLLEKALSEPLILLALLDQNYRKKLPELNQALVELHPLTRYNYLGDRTSYQIMSRLHELGNEAARKALTDYHELPDFPTPLKSSFVMKFPTEAHPIVNTADELRAKIGKEKVRYVIVERGDGLQVRVGGLAHIAMVHCWNLTTTAIDETVVAAGFVTIDDNNRLIITGGSKSFPMSSRNLEVDTEAINKIPGATAPLAASIAGLDRARQVFRTFFPELTVKGWGD